MANEDVMRTETGRDVVAARAEITGRRDQITAEYDDRLAALEQVATELDAGNLEPKAAQAQIRRILGGDRANATPRKAGRTNIGMSVPMARPTQAPPKAKPASQRDGPSATRAQVAVSRVLGQIDQRIIQVLRAATAPEVRAEARFELSLLLHLRRGLEGSGEELPTDVILLTSVVEHTDHAEAAVTDLEAGGRPRVERLLDHNRTLVAELLALGGSASTFKEQIAKSRAALDADDAKLRPILQEAESVFATLQRALEASFPQQSRSMLDEILRS